MVNGRTFEKRVNARAAELGIPIYEVAQKCGKSKGWLYQVFRSHKVRSMTIHCVAQALDVPTEYFFPKF